MSVFETVKNLTSFKSAEDKVIPRKKMGKILEAGRDSPSPGNVQSLEFIVVEDEHRKSMLADETGDSRVEEAPMAVIVISDIERMSRRVKEKDCVPLCMAEAACSIQNMRLVAEEEGVSSCWVTGFDEEMVADQFRIPEGKIPLGIVSFCYASKEHEKEQRFGIGELVFYDEYGEQIGSIFDQLEWEGLKENREILAKKKKGLIQKIREKFE